MSPETFFAYLQSQIVGRKVTYRRLAGNSLLIYIDCEPGDKSGFIIWLEPTWNFVGPESVLTGSRQAQHNSDEEDPDAGFRHAGEMMNSALHRTVEGITIEPITRSLILSLSEGYTIRTFVSDPTSIEDWYIQEKATEHALEATSKGIEFVKWNTPRDMPQEDSSSYPQQQSLHSPITP